MSEQLGLDGRVRGMGPTWPSLISSAESCCLSAWQPRVRCQTQTVHSARVGGWGRLYQARDNVSLQGVRCRHEVEDACFRRQRDLA
eukprot:1127232-Rhodomonas_salina.1